jgi:hypothetical protein
MTALGGVRKAPFLSGVLLITFSSLLFQILQTRIMSVIAWYYLAFFAISVAMLGMTLAPSGSTFGVNASSPHNWPSHCPILRSLRRSPCRRPSYCSFA